MQRLILVGLLLIFFSCKEKVDRKIVVSSSTVDTVSTVEDVTVAVSELLPAPNAFQLKQAQKWHDAAGENWLVLYETGSYIEKGNAFSTAKISAVLYLKSDSGFVQQWSMTDEVVNCKQEPFCVFYPNHLSITDLDQDALAEITFVYVMGCKANGTPPEKKLLLYEGKQNYTLTGEEEVVVQEDTIGGLILNDSGFEKSPALFMDFARKHWSRFGTITQTDKR